MISVLLTDDHELVRTGIRRLLEDSKQVSIIGEADCGEKSIQLAQEHQPDVILMDVNMPDMSGHEGMQYLRKELKVKKDIPRFALTAAVLSVTLQHCLLTQMDD